MSANSPFSSRGSELYFWWHGLVEANIHLLKAGKGGCDLTRCQRLREKCATSWAVTRRGQGREPDRRLSNVLAEWCHQNPEPVHSPSGHRSVTASCFLGAGGGTHARAHCRSRGAGPPFPPGGGTSPFLPEGSLTLKPSHWLTSILGGTNPSKFHLKLKGSLSHTQANYWHYFWHRIVFFFFTSQLPSSLK